jgi:hypothetical protein
MLDHGDVAIACRQQTSEPVLFAGLMFGCV